jgi:anti-sigma factor RsiW
MICRNVKSKMPDLLLDPKSVSADVRAHVADCPECAQELRELEATMAMMDGWDAPEVSPYFDGRMAVMLREEQQNPPAGWLERLRARLMFGEKMNLRPAAAAALALVIAVGGGMYGVFTDHGAAPPPTQQSQVIRDLQSLDENAEVFQQLNSMDEQQQDAGGNGTASASNL